jgi:hypothetical protein
MYHVERVPVPVQRLPFLDDDVTLSVVDQQTQDERLLAKLDRRL